MTPRNDHFWLLAAVLITVIPCAAEAQYRAISIGLNSLEIVDEDDPLSNDEPYLLAVRFRYQTDAFGALVPHTLHVNRLLGSHNNLGRGDDDWADERDTAYNLPREYSRLIEDVVPIDEPGWVIGAVTVFMEEDSYLPAQAEALGLRLVTLVEQGLRDRIDASSAAAAADGAGLLSQLKLHADKFDPFKDSLASPSEIDADDFGGVYLLMAATFASERSGRATDLFRYHGGLPDGPQWAAIQDFIANRGDAARRSTADQVMHELGGAYRFGNGVWNIGLSVPGRRAFPGNLSSSTERYLGESTLNVSFRTTEVPVTVSTGRDQQSEERLQGMWHVSGLGKDGFLFLYRFSGTTPSGDVDRIGTYYPLEFAGGEPDWTQHPLSVIGKVESTRMGIRNRLKLTFCDQENILYSLNGESSADLYLFTSGSGSDVMAGISFDRLRTQGVFDAGYARKQSTLTERSTTLTPISGSEHYPGRWRLVHDGYERVLQIAPYNATHTLGITWKKDKVPLRAWFEDAPDRKMWFAVDKVNPQQVNLYGISLTEEMRNRAAFQHQGYVSLRGSTLDLEPTVIAGVDAGADGTHHNGFYMVQLDRHITPEPVTGFDNSGYVLDEFNPNRPAYITGAVLTTGPGGEAVGVSAAEVTFTSAGENGAITIRSASNGEFHLHRPAGTYEVVATKESLHSPAKRIIVEDEGVRVVLRLADDGISPADIARRGRPLDEWPIPALPDRIPVEIEVPTIVPPFTVPVLPSRIDVETFVRQSDPESEFRFRGVPGVRTVWRKVLDGPRKFATDESAEVVSGRGGVVRATLEPGTYRVDLHPEAIGLQPASQVVTVAREEEVADLILRTATPTPESPIAVSGHVVVSSSRSPSGFAAVKGAVLEWVDQTGKRQASTTSDAGGRFSTEVLAGEYRVIIHAPAGYRSREIASEIQKGMKLQRYALARQERQTPAESESSPAANVDGNGTLAIRVGGRSSTHDSIAPLVGAHVTVIAPDRKWKTRRTSSEGTTTLTLPPGTYRVNVNHDGYDPQMTTVNVTQRGARQSIVLKPVQSAEPAAEDDRLKDAPFRIHVVTIPGGEFGKHPIPVTGARVSVTRRDQRVASGTTDRSGIFATTGTKGMLCAVRVEHPGYESSGGILTVGSVLPTTIFLKARSTSKPRVPDTEKPSVTATPVLVKGPETPAKLSISGRVHAPGTRSFGQAELLDSNRKVLRVATVSTEGHYKFTGLKPAKYHVRLKRSPDEFYTRIDPEIREADARKRSVANVNFTLR